MTKPHRTIVAFGDVHHESKYLNLLLPYLIDSQPDEIVIAGDLFDFADISHFDAHKRHYIGARALSKAVEGEILWGNGILDAIDCACPNAKKVFIQGNHDQRYDEYAHYEATQFAEEDRFLKNRLGLKDRGWQYVDLGGFYKSGKLYFMHGEKTAGELFVKQAAMKYRRNVRFWHHHTNQAFSATSPLDGGSNGAIEVKSVGCMCSKDPMYLRGTTNRWLNSFLVAHVLPNGNYQDFVVNIVGDTFIVPGGKVYK